MDLEAIEKHLDRHGFIHYADCEEMIAEIRRLRSPPEKDLSEAQKEANLIDACAFFGIDTFSTEPESPEKDLGREGNKDLTAPPLRKAEARLLSMEDMDMSEPLLSAFFEWKAALSGESSEPSKSPPVGPSPMELEAPAYDCPLCESLKSVVADGCRECGTDARGFVHILELERKHRAALKVAAKESPKLREWTISGKFEGSFTGFHVDGPRVEYRQEVRVREVPQSKGEATK